MTEKMEIGNYGEKILERHKKYTKNILKFECKLKIN